MSDSTQAKKSNRRTVILLVVVFVLPVVLAKLALETDYFQRKATNKGILLEPTLDFSAVNQAGGEQEPKWRLVYTLPNQCDQNCENALYGIHQVWLSLGRKMDRVVPVVVTTESSDRSKLASLLEQKHYHIVETEQASVDALFQPHGIDNIYLVDTLDNVVLRYPPKADQQEAVMSSKEMLSDLRKLLKLSRIG